MKAWTDYPIEELGDLLEGKGYTRYTTPVRKCEVVSYDTDKYCRVIVEGIINGISFGFSSFWSKDLCIERKLQ